jgi:hypothetical protein
VRRCPGDAWERVLSSAPDSRTRVDGVSYADGKTATPALLLCNLAVGGVCSWGERRSSLAQALFRRECAV